MQQNGQEDVLLNDVGRKSEARPVESHVEVAVAVEVIGTSAAPKRSRSKTVKRRFGRGLTREEKRNREKLEKSLTHFATETIPILSLWPLNT